QAAVGGSEAVFGFLEVLSAAQAGSQRVAELVEIEDAAVIARLVVQVHVAAGVEVDRHAPFPHRPKRLRPPRAAGLAVTAGSDPEDTLHVGAPRPLATVELGHALVPAEV